MLRSLLPVIAALALGGPARAASPVVDEAAGLPITQARVDAQVAPSEEAARAAARDEAVLHRAALDAGVGTEARYHNLVAETVAEGGRRLARRASRAGALAVDKSWLASVGGSRRDLPRGVRVAALAPGQAVRAGDVPLPVADAPDLAAGLRWLRERHQAAAATMVLAAGAPAAREAVVRDWVEQTLGPAVEREDIVPSRLKQWYEAHRDEFPEETVWVRTMHSKDAGEQQRAQLAVFRAHIAPDPERFVIYARMLHKDDPAAGALVGPIRPSDPGPLDPALAARILSLGEDGLSPVFTLGDQLWVVLVERREGGYPNVADRVEARVREEALARRTAQLLDELRP